ncbi:MAG: COX15/CtaA family protein [Isosphaeraceae bacterium]
MTTKIDNSPRVRLGPHRVALFAAVFTWPLLLVGGSVTVYRVGMAVPDWPTTFGINMFLYNSWNASWGVFIEHGHRLYGAAVGLACVVLTLWFAVAERRTWMKALGALALAAVIGQGVLGGYRVRHNSADLALIHGCTAQAFFALMVALVVLTGRDWLTAGPRQADPAHLRRHSAILLALIYVQIVVGALLRHRGENLIVLIHAGLAIAVWGYVAALTWRIRRCRAEVPALVPSARGMILAASAQVVLGVVAWAMLLPFDGVARTVTGPQALIRIGHQGVGALLLASAVVLTLRTYRHLAASGSAAVSESASSVQSLEVAR